MHAWIHELSVRSMEILHDGQTVHVGFRTLCWYCWVTCKMWRILMYNELMNYHIPYSVFMKFEWKWTIRKRILRDVAELKVHLNLIQDESKLWKWKVNVTSQDLMLGFHFNIRLTSCSREGDRWLRLAQSRLYWKTMQDFCSMLFNHVGNCGESEPYNDYGIIVCGWK